MVLAFMYKSEPPEASQSVNVKQVSFGLVCLSQNSFYLNSQHMDRSQGLRWKRCWPSGLSAARQPGTGELPLQHGDVISLAVGSPRDALRDFEKPLTKSASQDPGASHVVLG